MRCHAIDLRLVRENIVDLKWGKRIDIPHELKPPFRVAILAIDATHGTESRQRSCGEKDIFARFIEGIFESILHVILKNLHHLHFISNFNTVNVSRCLMSFKMAYLDRLIFQVKSKAGKSHL